MIGKLLFHTFVLIAAWTITSLPSSAQFSFHQGDRVLQFSGLVTTYYNHRFYDATTADRPKNRFALRDAQLEMRGWWGNKLSFKIKADFADLASNVSTGDQSGLMEATATLTPWLRGPEIKLGFDKPPFSRFAMVQSWDSPFFNRPEMDEGSFFPHRDIGVTLQQGFNADRVILYAGVYNGA
ncbi:MAG TPA: porin, partial [Chitinophagales bacterium]|nr:porin [Chitinophagales bacterium]